MGGQGKDLFYDNDSRVDTADNLRYPRFYNGRQERQRNVVRRAWRTIAGRSRGIGDIPACSQRKGLRCGADAYGICIEYAAKLAEG